MLPAREDIENDRLRQRDGWRTEAALEDPEEDQRLQRFSDTTQESRNAESGLRNQHDVAPAEPAGKPAGHRSHHGRRQYIEGHHPGDLIRRRGEAALHLRQDNADDQDRHRIERRRRHDRRHDHPAAERGHAFSGIR